MKIIHTVAEMREVVGQYRIESRSGIVGFVPTMGYLHEGHASLIRKAREECGFVVVSIFVNPLQFGPNEDFETYPRDEQRDLALAESYGADAVFLPGVEEMYPARQLTTVRVAEITSGLCGASRPGHFDGVSTVVTKLFNIVQPDRAYFGLKDAQQVAVITQMTRDLNMPVEIVPCPIVRESDGLALSSRNVYLSPEERQQALILYQSLETADRYMQDHSNGTLDEWRRIIEETIRKSPLADIDYVEIVQFPSLESLDGQMTIKEALNTTNVLVALAVKFGKTRLIDNRLWTSTEGGDV